MIIYFITMHSHMGILYYPWQEFSAITPPYWERFANTVSGNFHIAWIMSATVIVWLYETIWERYPFEEIARGARAILTQSLEHKGVGYLVRPGK